MELRILGAHNLETRATRLTALLVDGALALDAGSLTSGLSRDEQGEVVAVLLTHRHYDHVRDLPTLGLNTAENGKTVEVWGLADTLATVRTHLLDGAMYPDFTQRPSPLAPKMRLRPLEPGRWEAISGYNVLPIPVDHGPPAVAYLVVSPDGGAILYTGDMGGGLVCGWPSAKVDVLITEVTYPNRMEARARETGHMTADLLQRDLEEVKARALLPSRVLAVHMSAHWEGEIRAELAAVARSLGIGIGPAHEDMVVRV